MLAGNALVGDDGIRTLSEGGMSLAVSLSKRSSGRRSRLEKGKIFGGIMGGVRLLITRNTGISLACAVGSGGCLCLRRTMGLTVSLKMGNVFFKFASEVNETGRGLALVLSHSRHRVMGRGFTRLRRRCNRLLDLSLMRITALRHCRRFIGGGICYSTKAARVNIDSSKGLCPYVCTFKRRRLLMKSLAGRGLGRL